MLKIGGRGPSGNASLLSGNIRAALRLGPCCAREASGITARPSAGLLSDDAAVGTRRVAEFFLRQPDVDVQADVVGFFINLISAQDVSRP